MSTLETNIKHKTRKIYLGMVKTKNYNKKINKS